MSASRKVGQLQAEEVLRNEQTCSWWSNTYIYIYISAHGWSLGFHHCKLLGEVIRKYLLIILITFKVWAASKFLRWGGRERPSFGSLFLVPVRVEGSGYTSSLREQCCPWPCLVSRTCAHPGMFVVMPIVWLHLIEGFELSRCRNTAVMNLENLPQNFTY